MIIKLNGLVIGRFDAQRHSVEKLEKAGFTVIVK